MTHRRLVLGALLVVLGGGVWEIVRNHPPKAMDDTAMTSEGAPVTVDVLGNDSDPDRDRLTVAGLEAPRHGTASPSQDGSRVVYAPAPGFYGNDSFTYRAADPDGAAAVATVRVETQFTPPAFHQRDSAATLAEMIQEPPASVYGSTINVYLFHDEDGELREITIAGHADSLTCRETSGAFAGALLNTDMGTGNFLLAGSGRLSVPKPDPQQSERLAKDADVLTYVRFQDNLDAARRLVAIGRITQEQAEQFLGTTLDQAPAKLDALAEKPMVVEYLRMLRPGERAAAFVRQAAELQQKSGMLRIHEAPFETMAKVRERIETAAAEGSPRLLLFNDLAVSPDQEAVVYVPVRKIGSREDLVVMALLDEFSPEGFTKAAKVHRSALETSIVGSAKRRLEHAVEFLGGALSDDASCRAMPDSQKRAYLPGLRSCNKDGCVDDPFARKITYGEYCSLNVPRNINSGNEWKSEAKSVLDQINSLRERQDENAFDAMAHAALIDSMLRDWALPVPDAQAAFDYWRTTGRGRAWRVLTDTLAEQGIARAVLSGESVIFMVSLSGGRLSARPMMVIDLKRTAVLVDRSLGATAAVSAWELRQPKPRTPTGPAAGAAMPDRLRQPAVLAQQLAAQPAATVSALLDAVGATRPPEPEFWAARARDAERALARSNTEGLLGQLRKSTGESPLASDDDAWEYLIGLRLHMHLARHVRGYGPVFRLRVAEAVARGLLALHGDVQKDGWGYLKQAVSVAPPPHTDTREQFLFGESGAEFLRGVVAMARKDDAPMVDRALAAQAGPPESASGDSPEEPQPVLTTVIGMVERTRAALLLRAGLDRALAVFDAEGSAPVVALNKALNVPGALGDVMLGRELGELQLNLRYLSMQSGKPWLGPIEGGKMMTAILELRERITRTLASLEPELLQSRFGRDQDTMIMRLMFDQGQYASALDLLVSETVPLSLYASTLAWAPLDRELRGVPDAVFLREQGERVIAVARVHGQEKAVLAFDTLDQAAREDLSAATPVPIAGRWNEGDPLWEQILLASVPAPRPLRDSRMMLMDPAVRPWVLKAMVYACAVPGGHLLTAGGRCAAAEGSTTLHDRVQREGGVEFVVPAGVGDAEARHRFTEGIAWRPRLIESTLQ